MIGLGFFGYYCGYQGFKVYHIRIDFGIPPKTKSILYKTLPFILMGLGISFTLYFLPLRDEPFLILFCVVVTIPTILGIFEWIKEYKERQWIIKIDNRYFNANKEELIG